VQQLADACGVGRQAIYRWAHGTRAPGMVVRRHVNALARRRKLPLPYAEPSP
jgi:transcriptional regulator with XRE-family HTH domain